MAYVAKDDIILNINSEINFTQGNSTLFELFLYKDFIGNSLNLNEPTSYHVALFSGSNKVLQYSYPQSMAVSDSLNVHRTKNNGMIDFVINEQQGLMIPPGQLYAEVTVMYENYYPAPKTYVFPRIKLGSVVHGEGGIGNTNPPASGGNNGNGDSSDSNTGNSTLVNASTFDIEFINGTLPTMSGKVSFNSNQPSLVSSIVFKNLDNNQTRITTLENFLMNRITLEEMGGIITIYDTASTNMYAIYRIVSWDRVDIVTGNSNADDSDGVRINVVLESKSEGPGVTKDLWEIGQTITYSLDATGISKNLLNPDGINTYVDKNLNPTSTSGNEAATGITITHSPYYDSYVTIEVNGISVELGDGVKDKDSYFSGNNGLTAAKIEEIRAGDQLIWNGAIAGYDLEEGDEVNLIYEVNADDLR